MTRRILPLLVAYSLLLWCLAFCGCDFESSMAQQAKRCVKSDIDGTQCVICTLYQDSIAVSCDWNKPASDKGEE